VRKGGGPGCPALLNYDLLRSDLKQKVVEKYGDVRQYCRKNHLQELIEPDHKAAAFFREFLFDDDTNIKPDRQIEYNANAMVLNAIGKYVAERTGKHKSIGKRAAGIWDLVSEAVNNVERDKYHHSLPSNPLRLKEKYRHYLEHGYVHLIHKGNRNANAKKVNDRVERLVISLYCQQNLPFGTWVYDYYLQFLAGTLQIVDQQTGVLYDREDFFDQETGTYVAISRSTVWNIIHNPSNAIIIDRMRNNRIDHITQKTPYNHRRLPKYSLSKITMDDRDLPRKTTDGKRIKAYMAFDVLSDVVLGCVYSDAGAGLDLVWNCFRDLYQNIISNGLMWPGEVEVEQHLMSLIKDDLRQMFGYVTFCAPGNSKQKRAEHKIRSKKIGDEKRHQVGTERWYGKGAYKGKSNNKDIDYKEPRLPDYILIAEDRESIYRFNHSLHPNQKMFPGKTRWEVLIENMNPDLGRPQKHVLLRHLGFKTETSIRNNDFATVQYDKYAIDNLSAINRLKPNNYEVQAYYLPDNDSAIQEVYLYQGDVFVTRATRIERYNEAKIERTEHDEVIRTNQAKRQAHFFKVEKDLLDEKVARKLDISKPVDYCEMVPEIIPAESRQVDPNEELEQLIEDYQKRDYMEIGFEEA